MIQIRRITTSDPLYPQEVSLREVVLLHPIGFDMPKFVAMFPGIEQEAEHFVAVFDHPAGPRVVGTALLIPNYHGQQGVGKLMQMTVHPQRQGEGIGTKLVAALERRAFAELGLNKLFCHARDSAFGFYESLGWQYDSEMFDEAGIPHRRMIFENSTQDDE